eukprot:5913900-Lingulodinium_polyedra.AAC.1
MRRSRALFASAVLAVRAQQFVAFCPLGVERVAGPWSGLPRRLSVRGAVVGLSPDAIWTRRQLPPCCQRHEAP